MVVVGAGTAGLNAALQLARRGLIVTVIESRRLGAGGARWDNGVLAWQYTRAGIAAPGPDEVHHTSGRTHLYGPGDAGPVTFTGSTVHADMRRLNERLVASCRAEGVNFLDRATGLVPELVDRRVRTLALVAAEPESAVLSSRRLQASLFVDASGRRGVLRTQVASLAEWCPRVPRDLLCTASQHHFDMADRDGALRFLERHRATPGDTVTWVGLDGGFSALAVGVRPELDGVSVLTGTIATGRWGTGRSILDRFLSTAPWIGAQHHGGDGLIPLRRPHARLGASGVALVGDAACQVFPAHGSGIGAGMMAGAILAEQVGAHADPGSDDALWAYQHAFHSELGGTLAAYDAFRRCNSAIGSDGVRRMFASGLFTPEMAGSGLAQRWHEPSLGQSVAAARAYARDVGLARQMVPWLLRCATAERMGAAPPAEQDLGALRRWDRRLARVVGG
ncbi:MAG: FAD-dependent oxidoreductase [Actinobacteria bacterium]|nr:FAD-dependent oxidoreductase [Actinomycetota bacterium]